MHSRQYIAQGHELSWSCPASRLLQELHTFLPLDPIPPALLQSSTVTAQPKAAPSSKSQDRLVTTGEADRGAFAVVIGRRQYVKDRRVVQRLLEGEASEKLYTLWASRSAARAPQTDEYFLEQGRVAVSGMEL